MGTPPVAADGAVMLGIGRMERCLVVALPGCHHGKARDLYKHMSRTYRPLIEA